MVQEIEAPLAGKVIKLNIKVGDKVKEDDEALILEAMKMETPVFVPCDGTVEEVRANEGDEVEEDDILAIITED
jgi:acetyl-CoA carboxylase biotin carboxyl carrier protein